MKQKNIIITSLLYGISLFITSSCSNWLDVSPVDEVSKENLYQNPKGYYNVLNGIYLNLGSSELYGNNLSWGAVDAWARVYSLKDGFTQHETFQALTQLNYEQKGVESFSKNVWLNMYKNIARTNEFLQSCAKRNPSFFPNGEVEYRLLIGEATALRAMMHLDLLRIYAQTPAIESSLDNPCMPYVTHYPSTVNPKLTSREVLNLIEQDLSYAADCLAAYDTTMSKYTLEAGNRFNPQMTPEWGLFFSQRGSRMNYYATRLLQARASIYQGNHAEALSLTDELYNLIRGGKLKLMSPSNIKNAPKMMDEVLFGFYNSKLPDITRNWFLYSMQQALKIEDLSNFNRITNDKRRDMIENGILNIYAESRNTEITGNYIPNLKISELYYIRAEALVSQGRLSEAITLFNEFLKNGRGLTKASDQIASSSTQEEFMNYLINDMRKEFIGTGQILFYYKRLNAPVRNSSGADEFTCGKLVIPVPPTEDAI